MNINEVVEFFDENKKPIINSLDINENKKKVIYILDNGMCESITYIDGKRDISLLHGSSFDEEVYKSAYINSKYFLDDANYSLDSNKLISSVIPEVFKFCFKYSGKEYVINKISDNIPSYEDKLKKIYDRGINTDFKDFVENTIAELCSNIQVDNKNKIFSNDNRYNIDIKQDFEIILIDKKDITTYPSKYMEYVKSKMFTIKDGNYVPTMGSNSKKNYRHLNKNGIYDTFFYNENNVNVNDLSKFGTFLNLNKFIPNKYLILDKNYDNIFSFSKNYKNIGEIFDIISEKSITKDVRILESDSKGDVNFVGNINASNLNIKYRSYSPKNLDYTNNQMHRYGLYNKITELFNKMYINLFSENKDIKCKSSFSGNDILLDSLYEKIKDGLQKYIYSNDKSQLKNIYYDIEYFILNKKLFFKNLNGKITLDKNKIHAINDLRFNLTLNDNSNMNKLKEKEMGFFGYIKYDNEFKAKENLNQKGLDLLENKDVKFLNNLSNLYVRQDYTDDEQVGNNIENKEEFSFFIGKLLSILQKHSNDNNVHSWVSKFYNKTNVDAVDILLEIESRFTKLMDNDRNFYNSIQKKVLAYAMESKNEKIDMLSFKLGNLN